MTIFSDLYNASLIQKASISGLIEAPTTKLYPLDVVLQSCTLNSFKLKAGTGVGVVSLLLNSVAVAGLTEVNVTTTASNYSPSSTVNLLPNDVLTLSYVSGSSTDLFFTVQYAGLQVGSV